MERYEKLAGTHYISDIEYKQKQIDVSTAQQNVEDQRQALLQLHAAIESAEDDLNHLIVQGKAGKLSLTGSISGVWPSESGNDGQLARSADGPTHAS